MDHIVKILLLSFLITESQYPLSVHFIWNICNGNTNGNSNHDDNDGGGGDGYKKTRKCRSTANGQ